VGLLLAMEKEEAPGRMVLQAKGRAISSWERQGMVP